MQEYISHYIYTVIFGNRVVGIGHEDGTTEQQYSAAAAAVTAAAAVDHLLPAPPASAGFVPSRATASATKADAVGILWTLRVRLNIQSRT